MNIRMRQDVSCEWWFEGRLTVKFAISNQVEFWIAMNIHTVLELSTYQCVQAWPGCFHGLSNHDMTVLASICTGCIALLKTLLYRSHKCCSLEDKVLMRPCRRQVSLHICIWPMHIWAALTRWTRRLVRCSSWRSGKQSYRKSKGPLLPRSRTLYADQEDMHLLHWCKLH